ncbi:hypothetical protein JYT55_00765, partial [Mariprofundus ferrooxydans]|nr:hypothetical protein [Mariprofundus ferrooxydans]
FSDVPYLPTRQDIQAPNFANAPNFATDVNRIGAPNNPNALSAYSLGWGQPFTLAQNVRNEYNRLIGVAINQADPTKAATPTNHPMDLNSAWRNPARNKHFKGVDNSIHMRGGAVDLSIREHIANTSTATGLSHAELRGTLAQAGRNIAGTGICERGPLQVDCTAPNISHIHVEQQ